MADKAGSGFKCETRTKMQDQPDGSTEIHLGEKGNKQSILIAMDESEYADYAFHWYLDHQYQDDHYVILLHVPERHILIKGPLGSPATMETLHVILKEQETNERILMEKLAAKLKTAGIGGTIKSLSGKPGEIICQVAAEEHPLYILVGSRGHKSLRRTFLGSTSDFVVHHSHVPVFVCKHKELLEKHGLGHGGHGSPTIKERIMNAPLFRRKHKDSK